MPAEEIITELKGIHKQCQRQFKRSEDSVNYYEESEERLSMDIGLKDTLKESVVLTIIL